MFDEKNQNSEVDETVEIPNVESNVPVGATNINGLINWAQKATFKFPHVKVADVTKHDKVMMKTAYVWAEESYCKRRQVGAVLAKDGRILANGYNGTISGTANNCEEECTVCKGSGRSYLDDEEYCLSCNGEGTVTNDFTVHAEQNVIMFCAKHGINTNDATMYITTSPCKQCAKMIASVGIERVVYAEEYKDTAGIDFLRDLGIRVEHLR